MTKYVICVDADETLLHSVETENYMTYQNADFILKNERLAVYYRPYLFEFLYAFISPVQKQQLNPDQIYIENMELALFTKGTKDYADAILGDILDKLKAKYNLTQQQVNGVFKARLYREDLNSDSKDLNLLTKKLKVNVDNILLVDDLVSNFASQPNQGIQIIKYNNIKAKDTELLKLLLYIRTLDTSGKLTLKEQNIFRYSTRIMN